MKTCEITETIYYCIPVADTETEESAEAKFLKLESFQRDAFVGECRDRYLEILPDDQPEGDGPTLDTPPLGCDAIIASLTDCLNRLIEDLTEAHQDELDRNHYGDKSGSCSYCRDIAEAKQAIEEARGNP